jgi:hypothetical protein
VITRARYKELLESRKGSNENEGKGQASDQADAQVDDTAGGIILANSGELVINDGESNNPSQSGTIAPDITTHSHWQSLPTSEPVPVANHSEQPSCSMFEPVGVDAWNFDRYFVSEFLQRC